MADADGIRWDDDPVSAPPAAAPAGIVWDDETQPGPPRADFSDVQGGMQPPLSETRGTLAQLREKAGSFLSAGSDPTALVETGQQLVTGAVAPIPAGIAGLGQLAANEVSGFIRTAQDALHDVTGGAAPMPAGFAGAPPERDAADVVKDVQGAVTAQPETEHGKIVSGAVGDVLALPAKAGGALGEATLEATGSPTAAAIIDTATQAGAFALPGPHIFRRAGKVAVLDTGLDALRAADRVPVDPDALAGAKGPEFQGAAQADAIVNDALDAAPSPFRKAAPVEEAAPIDPTRLDLTPEERLPTAQVDQSTAGPPAAVEARPVAAEPAPAAARAAPVAESAPASVDLPPLYHGTKAGFESFDAAQQGAASDPGVFGAGHYATSDPRLASIYAGNGEGANVRQVRAELQNPKVFESPTDAVAWQGERGTDSPEAAARVRAKYEAAGHDGVVIKNNAGKVQEVVSFDPQKFRSPHEEKAPISPAAKSEPLPEAGADFTDVHAVALAGLKDELGWAERGGRVIRTADTTPGVASEVTGRTKWVPKSDFWPKYRETDPNPLNEAQAAEAFRKLDAGEALGKREQRFIRAAHDSAHERTAEFVDETNIHHETSRVADIEGQRASIREAARAEAAPPEERPNAGEIRSNPRSRDSARSPFKASEDGRGENLQRNPETGGPFAERDGGAGEARDAGATEEVVAPESGQTGIYNAKVAEERARKGLEEVSHDLSRTDPEGWARAKDKIAENPDHGRDLAKSFVDNPRPATKEEVYALILDRQRIKNARRAAYEDAEHSIDAGEHQRAIDARKKIARLDDEMEQNDMAAKLTGHEQAEGFRARQRMSREDYSMAELVQRGKVHKAGKLSAPERKILELRAKDIERREKALADHEAKLREARAKPRSPFATKEPAKRFDALAEQLKKIRDADQMTKGCVV